MSRVAATTLTALLYFPNSGVTALRRAPLREHFASSRVIKGLILQDQHD